VLAFAGPETIMVVALVALVVFGGSKIPELARSLGKAKGEFQKGLSDNDPPSKDEAPAPAAQAQAPAPAAAAPAPASTAAPAAAPEPPATDGSESQG